MIGSFKIKNNTTGAEVLLGQDIDCDYVYKDDGLDWGSAPAQHNTYSYPGQIGSSISSTVIKERDISIMGYVYYFLTVDEMKDMPRSQWRDYGYEIIKRKKEQLNNIINPDNFVRLSINDYYIEGKPSSSVVYGKTMEENNEYFCKFLINIFCNNPMFKKNTITKTVLSGSYAMLHSPFVIPPYGIVGGRRNNYLMLSVENEGNAEIGGRIILTAKGEIKNPSVENVGTGETITINKTMQNGERIIISTLKGKERGIVGIIDEVEMDYFQYWDFRNTWFQFQQGTTLIGYSTENDSENKLDVVIEINPEKYALEEM